MSEFIPPYPKRHEKALGPFDIIKHARRDLLSIWTEKSFEAQFIGTTIINRGVFIANCPEVVKHVFVSNAGNYERKSILMRKALEPLLGDGLFISDGQTWQKHREMEAPLFTSEHVANYSEVMVKTTEECVQRWATIPSGSTIPVLSEMAKLTAEIISRTLFGNQLGAAQATQVVEGFSQYQAAVEQMDITAFLGLPNWFPNFTWNKALKSAKSIHQVVDNVIAEGVKTGNQQTLLAHLLKLRDDKNPEKGLTSKQIRNELIVLFMAGHETTANTLAWAWYLVSQCPEVEQRLQAEVDEVLGNRSATFEDFSKLTYTQAIIEETLRLYPPVPILSREAKEEDTIRNRRIPAGSIMLVVPWLLHRHKKFWDKPDHFIPERFLADAPVKPNKFAYVPFSAGPRVCLAKFFGTVEATLCLAILAKNFRLAVPEGQTVTHECRLTLRPKDNLPMIITPR
jgi:cytochrome P450